MPDEQRSLAAVLDDIARDASASGDQSILNLVEEACDLMGFDDQRPTWGVGSDHPPGRRPFRADQ